VTEPRRVIKVAPDWQPWAPTATVTERWIVPEVVDRRVDWAAETAVSVIVTIYSILLGGEVGLLWPWLSPRIRLVDAINGSEAATKALLGDDIWLAGLGIVAGIFSALLLALVARDAGRGPGGAIGLAVGGVLGSLVAARVGHLERQPHIIAALQLSYPGISQHSVSMILGYFDFKVRAREVLVAWPLAGVIVHTLLGALRYGRSTTAERAEPAEQVVADSAERVVAD
jgi:hypothetical protein